MPAKPRPWTAHEDTFIIDHWNTMTQVEIGRKLRRNHSQISRRGTELGLANLRPRWTPDEDQVLRKLWGTVNAEVIAAKLNRNKQQVLKRARRLHLCGPTDSGSGPNRTSSTSATTGRPAA